MFTTTFLDFQNPELREIEISSSQLHARFATGTVNDSGNIMPFGKICLNGENLAALSLVNFTHLFVKPTRHTWKIRRIFRFTCSRFFLTLMTANGWSGNEARIYFTADSDIKETS